MSNSISGIVVIAVVLVSLFLQAVFPYRRVSIVLIGAAMAATIVVISGDIAMLRR